MDVFLQQVLSGLATGGIYASLALALVMIYQATDVVNFAQGEMAMFATYLAWSMLNAGMSYWLAFVATLVIAFVAGVAIQRIIIRPVETAPILTIVIVTLGLLVILNSVAGLDLDVPPEAVPEPVPARPDPRRRDRVRRARRGRDRGDPGHAGPALRVLPVHPARAGDAGGGAEPGVQPAGRDPRGLDARARLGARRGVRRGGRARWSRRSSPWTRT